MFWLDRVVQDIVRSAILRQLLIYIQEPDRPACHGQVHEMIMHFLFCKLSIYLEAEECIYVRNLSDLAKKLPR